VAYTLGGRSFQERDSGRELGDAQDVRIMIRSRKVGIGYDKAERHEKCKPVKTSTTLQDLRHILVGKKNVNKALQKEKAEERKQWWLNRMRKMGQSMNREEVRQSQTAKRMPDIWGL
jgi:hypothetical protein